MLETAVKESWLLLVFMQVKFVVLYTKLLRTKGIFDK